jgi:glycosyltransferase involved in cell wall biosynthesis
MRVLALVPSQKGHAPGQRGSIELWERVLAEQGIEIEYAPFETERLREILYQAGHQFAKASEMIKAYVNRLKLLRTVDEFDAVFVYREAALLGPAFLERRVAKKKPIIYQLDDPLFVPYRSPSNGLFSYLKFFGKVKEIIRMSKVVIVNSSHIREYASQFNSNIWQVPSVVDTRSFKFEPFLEEPDRVCVGWSGSPTTVNNIRLLEGPLQRISAENECDLHFIGGEKFALEDVTYTAQKWNGATEVEDLRRMQIGLVPLPDNPWNKYKFIMKTAQYMALGIVPIGTPMASNPEVIEPGVNGFLAKSDDEWYDSIKVLVRDHELRNKMSARAAANAQEKYSLSANKEKIVSAFRAAMS